MLDPEERTRETISTGKTKSTVISHYDASGGAVAWTGEGSGETEKWTRDIPGIDGTLTATQEGEGKTAKPVVLQLHDLEGNVIGTVGVSESETKLLTKYNSTEFGVPSGKEPPPKYAWLGAAGVAGELPSGVITQDGVTYVPITGRPLQTEDIALLAPQSTATPFSRPVEAWVGSRSGEGAAIELTNVEEGRTRREEANKPPGEIPFTPPSSWCGGEYQPCEEEEGPGEDGGADPSEGPNPWGCEVSVSWDDLSSGFSNDVGGRGHWKCRIAPPDIELQVALFLVVGLEKVFEAKGKQVWGYPGELGPVGSETKNFVWKCNPGSTYQIRVWARTWDAFTKKTNFVGIAYDGHTEKCPAEIGVDLPPGQ